MKSSHISKSDKETQRIGEEFSKNLKPGDTVLLYGDLGFGKTTFVKGIAKGLGITSRIISPTFTIVRTHGNLHHIDLYRIEKTKQIVEIGLSDLISDQNSLKLIEWPERMGTLPPNRWDIMFSMNNDDTRLINILKHE